MKIRNSRIIIFILLIEFTTGSVNASADPQGDIHPSDTKSVNSSSLGTTEIVSISNDGQAGNGYSSASSISADGRYIAFWSEAENLVNGDTNGTRDIFVQDLDTGQTTRVSIASDGSQANAGSGSYNTAISGDGRYVVFESHSTNLVPDDLNDRTDIFVHDRVTGQTTIVSTATDGTLGNSDSYFPSISADGNYIAFASNASNLVLDDTNDKMDVFVHDQLSGETTRISVASDGTQGDNISQTPSISADGRYVAFSSAASNFAPTEPFIFFIFVHDRVTG
ncbi:MAG: PD40 domain-containing protein, partial [Anaerolineales bacterium]|nr:PD40 domain-containing protein [Anaerolineales bacterium]